MLSPNVDKGEIDRAFLQNLFILSQSRAQRYKGIAFRHAIRHSKLSRQQKHILGLLARGLSNKEVAQLTGLTIHTVKYHSKEAYAKLQVNNIGDAILKARERGFIE